MWPSPRPESLATASPSARRQRREHERHAVGHAAGGVLVHGGPPRPANATVSPGLHHRPRERERLLVVEAAEQARHQERRRERVRRRPRRCSPGRRRGCPRPQRAPRRRASRRRSVRGRPRSSSVDTTLDGRPPRTVHLTSRTSVAPGPCPARPSTSTSTSARSPRPRRSRNSLPRGRARPRRGAPPPSVRGRRRTPVPEVAGLAVEARDEQGRPLARVIRGRRRRVAAVVPRDQQHAAVERPEQVRQPAVERLDAGGVAGRVVAVPVLRVEVHEVREHERRARDRARYSSVRSTPWSFESEYRPSVMPCPEKMSWIFPTPSTGTPASCRRSRTVGPGGGTEKSRRSGLRTNAPGSPSNGRAITRPTAWGPVRSRRATRDHS